MNFKQEIIDLVAKTLAGGVEFAAMKSLVADLESSELSGSEKRAKVIADFEQIGYGLAGWLVNVLLELAVAYIRTLA